MKKITLISIVIFVLVIVITFISSNILETGQLSQETILNNNKIEKFKLPVNLVEDSSFANYSYKSIINPPLININNLVFNLGRLSKDSLTIKDVSKHNTKNNCYLIINNKVYDVSPYIGSHPGGSRKIISRCGKEVTGVFSRIHSNRAWDILKKYKVGIIDTGNHDITYEILTEISDTLEKANPDAEIIKVSPKMNFYVAKIIYNKKIYEVHIDNLGNIIKEEVEVDEVNWDNWENDYDDK